MTGRLEGKVAIVTGAGCIGPGWGNGRATACRFAEEGAHVFAVDLSQAALDETVSRAKKLRGKLQTHICDVTKSESVAAMVDAALERFGQIDILVNNVGGSAKGGAVELSEEGWNAQVDYNLKSVFLTCKYALPHLARQINSGLVNDASTTEASINSAPLNSSPTNRTPASSAIVNVASTSGIRWTGAAQVAYAATKAGVIQLSRVTAVEYATRGIRVNTVVPGQLHTPMVEARLAGQRTGGDVDALLAERIARIPLGFMGDGRDTANAAVFLASDEARFVTGTEIIVDGGMTARCD